jgi:hypothetical protein
METQVGTVPKFRLDISHARFQKDQNSRFITVLFDGRIGEIFVPYHPGSPRFADISGFPFEARTLTAADCPPPAPRVAEIIGGTICKEKRTYTAWDNKTVSPTMVRYGEEVVYWSLLDAANYSYIMEWTFRDDGTILARRLDGSPVTSWNRTYATSPGGSILISMGPTAIRFHQTFGEPYG